MSLKLVLYISISLITNISKNTTRALSRKQLYQTLFYHFSSAKVYFPWRDYEERHFVDVDDINCKCYISVFLRHPFWQVVKCVNKIFQITWLEPISESETWSIFLNSKKYFQKVIERFNQSNSLNSKEIMIINN